MSLMAKVLYQGFKLAGFKKMFALPQEELLEKVYKMNEKRANIWPKDHKFNYEKKNDLSEF